MDVDKLAGQLNDEVNKLNEKLNSGIVPQVLLWLVMTESSFKNENCFIKYASHYTLYYFRET